MALRGHAFELQLGVQDPPINAAKGFKNTPRFTPNEG